MPDCSLSSLPWRPRKVARSGSQPRRPSCNFPLAWNPTARTSQHARPQSRRLHWDTSYRDCSYRITRFALLVPHLHLSRATDRWLPLITAGRPARPPVLSPYFTNLASEPHNHADLRTSVQLPASSCLAGTSRLRLTRETLTMTARDVYSSQHRFFCVCGGGSCPLRKSRDRSPSRPEQQATANERSPLEGSQTTAPGARTRPVHEGVPADRRRPGRRPAARRGSRHTEPAPAAVVREPRAASRPLSPCRPLLEGAGSRDRVATRRVYGRPVRAHGRRHRLSDASEVRPSPARRRPASRPAGPSCHVPCRPPTLPGAGRTPAGPVPGRSSPGRLTARPGELSASVPEVGQPGARRHRGKRSAERTSPATNGSRVRQSAAHRPLDKPTPQPARAPARPRCAPGRPFSPSPGLPGTAEQGREPGAAPDGHRPEVSPVRCRSS